MGAPLIFGVVPHTDDAGARFELEEFCKRLSRMAGVEVRPHRTSSPAALATAFGAGLIHFAWASPGLFLMSEELRRSIPLVSAERTGIMGYHTVLFALEDSPYKELTDLEKVRAAWVAPTSAGGYIVPRLAIARAGLDPRELFSEELFCDTHGGTARALLEGRADVGASFARFEEGDASKALLGAGFLEIGTNRKFRVLHAYGPIPSDMIVASPTLDPGVRGQLRTALEDVAGQPGGSQQLQSLFGASAFRPFDPHHLSTLRQDVERGLRLGVIDDV